MAENEPNQTKERKKILYFNVTFTILVFSIFFVNFCSGLKIAVAANQPALTMSKRGDAHSKHTNQRAFFLSVSENTLTDLTTMIKLLVD